MSQKRNPIPDDVDGPSVEHQPYINNSNQKQTCGVLFADANIYSLHYIVKHSDSPSKLRFNLLRYTKLHLPHYTDLIISDTILDQEAINKDISDTLLPLSEIASSASSPLESTIDHEEKLELSLLEIGQCLRSIVEVLGVSVEKPVQEIMLKLSLPHDVDESIQAINQTKARLFEWMVRRGYEDQVEKNLFPLSQVSFNEPDVFCSIYDESIQQVFQEYLKLSKSEEREEIELSSMKIQTIIKSAITDSENTIMQLNNQLEDSKKVLTHIEISNLQFLSQKMEKMVQYFIEKSKPIGERTFFMMHEVLSIPQSELDSIHFLQLTHYEYFDERFIYILMISMCSMSNSKGGHIFLGIHSIYNRVKGIGLWEILSHQLISEIRRLGQQLSPALDIETKIIKIITPIKDRSPQQVTIRLSIPLRKANTVYVFSRNKGEQKCYIKNKGTNMCLREGQEEQLRLWRSQEKDTPDLEDYLRFSGSYKEGSSHFPRINKSNLEGGDDIISEEVSDSNQTSNYEKYKYSGNINKCRQYNDIKPQKYQNDFDKSMRSIGRQNPFTSKPSYTMNGQNSSILNGNRLRNNNEPKQQRRQHFLEQFNLNQVQNKDMNDKLLMEKIDEEEEYIVQRQKEIMKRQNGIQQTSSYRMLEGWRKKRIVECIKNIEGPLSLSQFKESLPVKTYIDKLETINLQNCYLIYTINSTQYQEFVNSLSQQLQKNHIQDFEFIGQFEGITVLKIEREKYGQAKIERIVGCDIINWTVRNFQLHGFTFEDLELKNCFNSAASTSILQFLLGSLDIPFSVKLNTKGDRVHLQFKDIISFIFAYQVLKQIKNIFSADFNSRQVKLFFNCVNKSI